MFKYGVFTLCILKKYFINSWSGAIHDDPDLRAPGGFGVVFRVVSQHGHTYALKRTCVNNSHDLSVCKREINIVSSLSHKNIIRYVDSKIIDIQQGIYEVLLLTTYYPGSLSQLINERKQHHRFTEAEVIRIFSDVCEAVCRLHHCKTPIIHRDLKIDNILIDDRNNFVLCDFGSATSRVLHPGVHGLGRCEEEISRYTTLAYRAPEMVNLSASIPLGPQIDIWALGCMLYCICYFNLPFGDSILAIQSGNFSLPDNSPYSERLHKLIDILTVSNQNVSLAFQDSFNQQPSTNLLGHKRCPSDTSSFLKIFTPTLRHIQSLASLSQVSQSFDSMANSYSTIEYTSVGSIISSSKQNEVLISPRLNVIDQPTTITTTLGVQHLSSSGNPDNFISSSSQQQQHLSSTMSSSTPLQHIQCNQTMINNNKSITKTVDNVDTTATNVYDDDILFGAAFDAIRGSSGSNNDYKH
ncbi:serine/threonine kinase [Schistosoma mansoni]|uniref:serine/threonine kinase n=1 Tax=Schistosoma mansoni TaxID=6183 RepID=UPI00019B3646|nr:serine/threonine kinase [Schistosoma mansoni]|eukprot:XP_018652999.1 serine/threonine kinase [Schistosoma mansoni]